VDIGEQNVPAPTWYLEAAGQAKPAASSRTAPKRSTPVAATPKIVRVPAGDGASNKAGVLNVYSYVELNQTGTLIVELASHFPKVNEIYVTSGMDGDHGPRPDGSYHYGHLTYNGSPAAAVDFGAYDKAGTTEGDLRMRDLARWFEDVVPGTASIVELIHTTPFADDNGFYVKDGQRIASYGAATDAAHLNHVHLAMSQAQLTPALARLGAPHPVPSSAVTYTVVSGDTLTAIAAKFHTTVPAILKLNPSIEDPNVISVGQRIRVK
jgi:nucleoid-associated protein YgaU